MFIFCVLKNTSDHPKKQQKKQEKTPELLYHFPWEPVLHFHSFYSLERFLYVEHKTIFLDKHSGSAVSSIWKMQTLFLRVQTINLLQWLNWEPVM